MTSGKSAALLIVDLAVLLTLPAAALAVPAPQTPELMVQEGHASTVESLAFSPDGKLALTTSYDGTVRLWDVATGRQVLRLMGNKAVFSPDGRHVLTAGPDTNARLWSLATGKVTHTLQGHARGITSLAISRDGGLAVTGGGDRTARLWDLKTGKQTHVFTGHTNGIRSVAISPDGQFVLTGSEDNTARLWKTANSEQVHLFQGHTKWVVLVAFSGDGQLAVTGSWDNTARLWDVKTGKQVQLLDGHDGVVNGLAFGPDNQLLLVGRSRSPAQLWNLKTGKNEPFCAAHNPRHNNGGVNAVAFSSDGALAVTAGIDGTTALIDVKTARLLHLLRGHTHGVGCAAFSPDGKYVFTGSLDRTARFWDVQTGKPAHPRLGFSVPVLDAIWGPQDNLVLGGGFDRTVWLWDVQVGKQAQLLTKHEGFSEEQTFGSINALALRADGKMALSAGADETVRLWNVQKGEETQLLRGHTNSVELVSFSPDGKFALSSSQDRTAQVWDLQAGRQLHVLNAEKEIQGQCFSPDGKRVLLGYADGAVRLWDAQTGKIIHLLQGHDGFADVTAFSPDGNTLLTGNGGGARLWDARTGKLIQHLEGQIAPQRGNPFSPDGKSVVTFSGGGAPWLWDVRTGKLIRGFDKATSYELAVVAFSADGKRLLTGSADKTVRLYDVETGKQLHCFEGHTSWVNLVAFSPDGKRALSVGEDKTTRFWNLEKEGEELCRLVVFTDGSWVVVDPEHRYDASNGGDVAGLHWVVGLEPIALNQLKERYYEPGLLAKRLGRNKDPLRPVTGLAAPKLYPEVHVAEPTRDNPKLAITLTDRGGGIGRVVVKLNGKEVTADARPDKADSKDGKLKIDLDLRNDPLLKPGVRNVIEVQAYNEDGYLRSRGMEKLFLAEGQEEKEAPKLWAIVAGVSRYANPGLELRYAAKDAEDFARALQVAGGRLFGTDKVRATVLTTVRQEAELQPTRANLIKALEAARKARPGDVLVIYLAGHGVNHGGADGDFFFLTRDAGSADLTDPEVRRQSALSSGELTELLKKVPAQKQVLILDTCAAGKAIAKFTEKRDVPSSQVRALERVKDRTGLHVLAGCAADSVSYEATRYGQGVLTYSLLLGMRGAKLRDGEYVDVVDLFGFAADKVPELARDVGGVQRPVIASPLGSSFDIGRVTAEDRDKVPLQAIKPVLSRCSFQEEKRFRDGLSLTRRVDDWLREKSVGREGRLVFVDAAEFPGALQTAGRYKQEKDKVTVTVTLYNGEKEIVTFTVEGPASQPDQLAEKISIEVEKKLAEPR